MKFLSKKQVKELTTYSYTQIGRLEQKGTFPKRLRLGKGRYARVVWIAEEVLTWMANKVAERDNTPTTSL